MYMSGKTAMYMSEHVGYTEIYQDCPLKKLYRI